MPGTTAGGLPYPLPTEPVRDGAQRIRELAERLDTAEWEVFRSENQNCTTSTWQQIGYTTTPVSRNNAIFSGSGSGITVKVVGRYLIHAAATFSANTAGRRGICVLSTAGGSPGASTPQLFAPALPSGAHPLVFSTVQTCGSNTEWAVFLFQDSGATLLASNVRFTMYRLPQ